MLPQCDGMLWTLYALVANHKVRYIGITSAPKLEQRLHQHLTLARRSNKNIHVLNWIRECRASGKVVKIKRLVSGLTKSEAQVLEISTIQKHSCRLVNSHTGGFTGMIGMSEDVKKKWRKSQEQVYVINGGKESHFHKLGLLGAAERWKNKVLSRRERLLRKMAAMRAAKERKRIERGPREEEPKMIVLRHPHLSWAMRDDLSGEIVWMSFLSVRDMARRAGLVAKFYDPRPTIWHYT